MARFCKTCFPRPISTRPFPHFLHPPTDVAAVFLGQRPLVPRRLADFNSVITVTRERAKPRPQPLDN